MFCFQCEQTAGCAGCTGCAGVCGKTAETANLQDELTGALIGLARACENNKKTENTDQIIIEGLFTTITNVNFNDDTLREMIQRVNEEKHIIVPDCSVCKNPCGNTDNYDMKRIWEADEDIRSLKSLILFGIRGMSAYAYHAKMLGYTDETVNQFFYKALCVISYDFDMEHLLPVVMETGEVNLACMALLDRANTTSYGTPVPTKVSLTVEKGPFIVVSGHDLEDMHQLLEQTKDKGINVYTHCEMLPAHGYPGLKKYSHLAGNFGTSWQSQQKEFENIPAPVLFTTNCLMPPRESYRDRVYTTSVVGYEGLVHISGDANNHKDFTPVIEKALELGGYENDHSMSGINGGHMLTTGFAHNAILENAGKIISLIKEGKIKHIFLVGGCDGAHPGRNYYTEFVKNAPMDSIILTLACGKYRFNDIDLGEIDGIPRILDVGQCNDSYSAIQVALALADAFGCSVNELPLTLVLSWYEQKAVCILITLLSLGIKGIYLGPTMPAFFSENVLKILEETFDIRPITDPKQDLDDILGRG